MASPSSSQLPSSQLTADLVRPADLAVADVAAWRAMQAAEPAFASPLLGVEFAQAVGRVRDDARVAVFRRRGETIGFLAFHQRPSGFARPIGAPFCDYHALISRADGGLTIGEALTAAGLHRLRLTGLVDPFGRFGDAVAEQTPAHRIVLTDGAETYLTSLRTQSQHRFKNHRRYSRALERDLGPVRLVAHDGSTASYDLLMDWKRRQIAETGVHDFLGADWARALMRGLFQDQAGDLRGLMISLYAGDRLVAAHFGVAQNGWFHPWIGAFDPALKAYSPGLVHQIDAVAAMTGLGLSVYDLGAGSDHWKSMFALVQTTVGSGLATAPSFSGRLGGAVDRLWRAPMGGRLRRRFDQISAVELTLGGRLQGAALALRRAGPTPSRSKP